MSESVLWFHVIKSVLGYDLILGAVYYSNDVFEFHIEDMTTIRANYDVPTILLGDINARIDTTADF